MLRLADTALLVRDHDEALAFYVGILRFRVAEDRVLPNGKRWVRIKLGAAGLVLRRASDDNQRAHVGNQTGGSVLLFLETDDIDAEVARLEAAGVRFTEPVRSDDYGRAAVFVDLYGNRIDLIEPAIV